MAAERQELHVSRRRFVQGAGVTGLGLLAGCGRLPFQRQPPLPAQVARIGWLGPSSATEATRFEHVRQGLREHGWIEGHNFVLEARFAEGREEHYLALAAELVALPVDVLLTASTPAIRAAKEATSTIPIVFAAVGDPIAEGFVASYARPGGNLTGLTIFPAVVLQGKRLELLREALPEMARVALFWTPTSAPSVRAAEEAARTLGVDLQAIQVRTHDDLEGAFGAATGAGAEALLFTPDAVFTTARARIVALAAHHGRPAIYHDRVFGEVGGLMTYGPRTAYNWRRAADYVDRILKGATPADLPVEQPMLFDFVINLRTAQALGLTIPQHVLLQATEVIS
jgi:putative ABC transport system substrate-binding protein